MLGSLFFWIRVNVKNAVLAGFGDAIAELHVGTPPTDEAIAILEERLRPAITHEPEAEQHEPTRNGRAKVRA